MSIELKRNTNLNSLSKINMIRSNNKCNHILTVLALLSASPYTNNGLGMICILMTITVPVMI